jgi:hypothetical protein
MLTTNSIDPSVKNFSFLINNIDHWLKIFSLLIIIDPIDIFKSLCAEPQIFLHSSSKLTEVALVRYNCCFIFRKLIHLKPLYLFRAKINPRSIVIVK